MKKLTTLLFDVDGTLLDTTELIFQAFESSFKMNGQKIPSRTLFTQVVGKPLDVCYQILTGHTDVTSFTKAHQQFQLKNLDLSVSFPNTRTTLQQLKARSFKIAAVTSRKRASAEQTLHDAGIFQFLDFAVYADDVTNHKPHPEPLLKSLHALSSTPDEAMMIGDTEADILGGKNAGTQTAGALYGFHGERLKDAQPDYTLNDISDILSIVNVG